jgi:hypothetical protein
MSELKVNKISPKAACGTTTLGDSGDTFTIPAGVTITNNGTQTGFGRTGAVDWQTSSIKTGDFTAVNAQGFFVDTNSGAVNATLPAGSAGAIISFQDYRNTFDTNNLNITPNGSEKINGGEGPIALSTEGEGITLVYIDSTVGWRSIQDNDFAQPGSNYIKATGGTETTSGDCKIHTFTSPGSFVVTAAGSPANASISYLIVAGGGGGGWPSAGGGGGAGGYREVKTPLSPYTASPLDGYGTPGNRVSASAGTFPIVVGAGGGANTSGSVSSGLGISSAGGGSGGQNSGTTTGGDGGSGGGASGNGGSACISGGSGNTPPVTPPQGFPGGTNGGGGPGDQGDVNGGGGGATEAGTNASPGPETGGRGGAGTTSSITASPVAYAGGGGAGYRIPTGGTAGAASPCGTGGSGAGSQNGTTNRGGGGGGGVSGGPANGNGGSGIVVIRYKFQ